MAYSVQREGGKADDEIQDMVFEFPGAWREVATGIDLVDVGEVDIGFRYRYYHSFRVLDLRHSEECFH